MRNIIQDFGALVIIIIFCLLIGETIKHFFNYDPIFGEGFLSATMFYDWYKKR